jgi:hypothetical protein
MIVETRKFKNFPRWAKDLFESGWQTTLNRRQVEMINRFCTDNLILAVDSLSFSEDEYMSEKPLFGEPNVLCCTLTARRYLHKDNERKEYLRWYKRLNEI